MHLFNSVFCYFPLRWYILLFVTKLNLELVVLNSFINLLITLLGKSTFDSLSYPLFARLYPIW